MKTQIADLQSYQLELIHFIDSKKRKRKNLIKGYLLFIAFELMIILPIALYYYLAKG